MELSDSELSGGSVLDVGLVVLSSDAGGSVDEVESLVLEAEPRVRQRF